MSILNKITMPEHQKNNPLYHQIKSLKLFEGCCDTFITLLTSQAQVLSLNKGQILFLHGDNAERFYIITKGWVKIFRETVEGKQAVLDILTANNSFGETALFQNDEYPYSAEATQETQVISLPLADLKKEIKSNQKFSLAMLESIAKRNEQQEQELEHRTLQNASQRIGCFLLKLVNKTSDGKIIIELPYDKTLIAARLGMQPETFSRALGKLKKETGIEIKGGEVNLTNLNQLSDYACAACSSEFPCKILRNAGG